MIVITEVNVKDASTISDIAIRSKAHWGYDESFMLQAKGELTYGAPDIKNHTTFKAVDDELTMGFYQLIHVDELTIELDALFIDPTFIGQGLGEQLFHHAASKARQLGYQTMSIQSDPFAEGFYYKLGCAKVGEKPSLSIPGRVLPAMVFDLLV